MKRYLADTSVLIEHLRGNIHAKHFLEESNPSISTVTIAELIQGARDKQELASVSKICASLSTEAIDKKISQRAIELLSDLYLSHGLMFLDALIAATALENKMVLVTSNIKHFRKIARLEVISQDTLLKK
ncbi:MAG: type II toxin-antitoxin system VapC family toxin [Candidatus Levybacteria bacterium]|nr:type II toxin-antitoxin system VapC family toxin [Candidatus Levybacteria bacterium]